MYKRFSKILDMSSEVFEYAAQTGHEFTTVDIGGGFQGNKEFHTEFIKISTKISLCIEEFARKFKNIRVIAEPGKFTPLTVIKLESISIWVLSNCSVWS